MFAENRWHRYFERLAELNEAPIKLAALRVGSCDPSANGETIRQLLVSMCYPMDLALIANGDRSVMLIGSTMEPESWMTRLKRLHASRTSEAGDGAAFGLTLDCLGCWPFVDVAEVEACALGQMNEKRVCA